ncbi:hypothetical protein C2G38_2199154 [Gigaspora rosea]|uniref:HCP-like protein n=1 Tax=Gigaspora rosea TaxID=44941 RepID=A0A397US21_9GLOM|nr:hypothetical protein C2G38_2199154 [Gigaspora rosea]
MKCATITTATPTEDGINDNTNNDTPTKDDINDSTGQDDTMKKKLALLGTKKDEHKASTYFLTSGRYYQDGIGVEKNVHKAFICYQKSADIGNANGTLNLLIWVGNTNKIFELGNCYQNEISIKKNKPDMGNANGIFELGNCYQNGIGVKKDEHIYFLTSGRYYQNGIGIKKNKPKIGRYRESLADFTKLLEIELTYQMMSRYKKSLEDYYAILGIEPNNVTVLNGIEIKKNKLKAFIYYQKSADTGNADEIFELGNCYQNGIGVKNDEHKASTYFLTSGRYYQNGIRVEKNLVGERWCL